MTYLQLGAGCPGKGFGQGDFIQIVCLHGFIVFPGSIKAFLNNFQWAFGGDFVQAQQEHGFGNVHMGQGIPNDAAELEDDFFHIA